jgi:tRNA(Arg) A34 adenosine deaminase TadA
MPKQVLFAVCYDKQGRVISTGKNSYTKTHPLQKYFANRVGCCGKEYLHAEIAAIIKARGQPIHTLCVTRINRLGDKMLSKPCPICMEACKAFGIKRIIYTDKEGKGVWLEL